MTKDEKSRSYVAAVWHVKDGTHPSPKISGGYTVDKHGVVITARPWNRPDQRYSLPLADMNSRRDARAYAEQSSTLLLLAEAGSYLLVSASANRYGVSADLGNCSCPDEARLQESIEPGQTGTPLTYYARGCRCKHIRIVNLALNNPPVGGIPYSTWYVASQIGISPDTVAAHCKTGDCIASLQMRTYVITHANGDDFITRYTSRLVGAL